MDICLDMNRKDTDSPDLTQAARCTNELPGLRYLIPLTGLPGHLGLWSTTWQIPSRLTKEWTHSLRMFAFAWISSYSSNALLWILWSGQLTSAEVCSFVTDDIGTHLRLQWVAWDTKKQNKYLSIPCQRSQGNMQTMWFNDYESGFNLVSHHWIATCFVTVCDIGRLLPWILLNPFLFASRADFLSNLWDESTRSSLDICYTLLDTWQLWKSTI